MLLALEDFELACLCPEQRLERQRRIEHHRRFVAQERQRARLPAEWHSTSPIDQPRHEDAECTTPEEEYKPGRADCSGVLRHDDCDDAAAM
jgi:hypothetical protein